MLALYNHHSGSKDITRMKVIVTFILTLCFYQSFASNENYYKKEGCYTFVTVPDDGIEEFPLSKNCLQCICQMMTGCQSGCRGNACGAFGITREYWAAAHNKENHQPNQQAYQDCTNNAFCAVRTVQRYMKKNLPDIQSCRPDRSLCENAVALHYMGTYRGHHELSAEIQQDLFTCLDKRIGEWLGIDKVVNDTISTRPDK